jgi:RNA polymerase sigma factor (sigma-70 family)
MQQAIRHGGRAQGRPTREEIDPAARALVERHSVQIIATARRYSLSAEDAEDAYQRGLEILLMKAPSVHEDDLVPWLKTVVKHEAFAIRRQRQRADLSGDRELAAGFAPATHDQVERHERLRIGAEAMSRLKPQELRCLLLRAEGYSYKQICDETGWTYTKVNRCVTEGRKAFLNRVRGIEAGLECERMAPLLSRLVDGEASAEDMAVLRPHIRSCLACRATLRDFRDTPAQVAAFLPLLATPGLLARGLRHLQDLLGFIGAHKTAAVVAVTVAAAGGVATVHSVHRPHRPPPPKHRAHKAKPRPPVAHIATQVARAPKKQRPAIAQNSRNAARRTTRRPPVASAPQQVTPLAAPPPQQPRRAPAAATPSPKAGSGSEFGP